MRFKDQDIPEQAIGIWRDLILNSSDEDVIRCTRGYKFMSTGFRAGKAPVSHLRTQLLSMLDKGEMSAPLLDTIQAVGLTNPLIRVLSVEAIEFVHEDLADFFGNSFYASMLVDSRDEIRELGIRNLTKHSAPEQYKVEKTKAANNVLEKLHLFAQTFAEVVAASKLSQDTPEDPTVLSDPLNSEMIKNLRSDLASQKKELKRSIVANERLNAEVLSLRTKLEKSERARQKIFQDYQEVQKLYSELSAVFDQKVEAEVARQTDDRIIPWLSRVEKQEAALVSKDFQELESQAREILSLQAADDKLYGTRSGLRSTKKRLESLRDEILEALTESIRPRKDLKRALELVEVEINRVAGLLDPSPIAQLSSECIELLKRINFAQGLDEIASIRTDKTRLGYEGKLRQDEAKLIGNRIQTKSDIFYREQSKANPEQEAKKLLSGLPATLFRTQIRQGKIARLVVDGHNVLFALTDIFKDFYEGGVPKDKARAELIARIDKLSQYFSSLKVDLWFDSPFHSRETISEQLSVFYSGGQGVNRADDQIVQSLEASSFLSNSFVYVVTDDQELAGRSRKRGVLVLGCDEFCGLIE